jgi:hypothetical protein
MIRAPRPSDQGFIAATWSRSMLSSHVSQRHLRSRTGQQISAQIDRVLDRPDTRALVCCPDAAIDTIYGWLLYVEGPRTPVVHYAYSRHRSSDGTLLRGRGIMSALLAEIGVTRNSPVVCTSNGPASEVIRGIFKASVFMPLDEFLK